MIDIVAADNGSDLQVFDTQTPRAANILSVQLGDLEYIPDFGIDKRYFLSENIKFQDASFQSYLVQALANQGINVASVIPLIAKLTSTYKINLQPQETSTGLIAR